MEKIEINDVIINKVAEAEFNKKQNKKELKDMVYYIRIEWRNEAREMLENYNRVVEIMSE